MRYRDQWLRQLSRERTAKSDAGPSERKQVKTVVEKREAGEMAVCSWVAWVKLFYLGLDPLIRHLEDWGANTRRSRRLHLKVMYQREGFLVPKPQEKDPTE